MFRKQENLCSNNISAYLLRSCRSINVLNYFLEDLNSINYELVFEGKPLALPGLLNIHSSTKIKQQKTVSEAQTS